MIARHGGRDDYAALFHEAGHTEHYANVEASLPFEFRYLGDNSVTEGFAFLFEHLTEDPAWLRAVLGADDADGWPPTAGFTRASKFVFLRRYAAKLSYELELHGGGRRWTRCRRCTHGCWATRWASTGPRPPTWPTWTSGYYAANYLRAWAFETHLRGVLVERFGPEWFRVARGRRPAARAVARGPAPGRRRAARPGDGRAAGLRRDGRGSREQLPICRAAENRARSGDDRLLAACGRSGRAPSCGSRGAARSRAGGAAPRGEAVEALLHLRGGQIVVAGDRQPALGSPARPRASSPRPPSMRSTSDEEVVRRAGAAREQALSHLLRVRARHAPAADRVVQHLLDVLARQQHGVQRREHAAHDPVTRGGHLSGAAWALPGARRSRRPSVARGPFRWLSSRCALRGRSAPSTAGHAIARGSEPRPAHDRTAAGAGAPGPSARPAPAAAATMPAGGSIVSQAAREDVVDPVRFVVPHSAAPSHRSSNSSRGARPHVEVASEQHRRAAGPFERDLGGPASLPRGLASARRAQVQVPDAHLPVAVDQSRERQPPPLAQAPLPQRVQQHRRSLDDPPRRPHEREVRAALPRAHQVGVALRDQRCAGRESEFRDVSASIGRSPGIRSASRSAHRGGHSWSRQTSQLAAAEHARELLEQRPVHLHVRVVVRRRAKQHASAACAASGVRAGSRARGRGSTRARAGRRACGPVPAVMPALRDPSRRFRLAQRRRARLAAPRAPPDRPPRIPP